MTSALTATPITVVSGEDMLAVLALVHLNISYMQEWLVCSSELWCCGGKGLILGTAKSGKTPAGKFETHQPLLYTTYTGVNREMFPQLPRETCEHLPVGKYTLTANQNKSASYKQQTWLKATN